MAESPAMNPMPRRAFLIGATAAAATMAVRSFPFVRTASAASLTLSPLPYAENALEPVISSRTLGFHYGKHHKGYLDKLNELVAGGPMADASLESIIKSTAEDATKKTIFNNAAQVWNHSFYWRSLKPDGGGKPTGDLAAKVDAAFGSYDGFKTALVDAGTSQFGSGWAWLVEEKGQFRVVKTPNAETPLTAGLNPLLTVDVWEHAYYLDYQNLRKDYLNAVIDKLLNWEFASENLARG